ncbi:amino acid permease [Flammeovirgaceae bacterium SG7u.111]|nr:amino acid permease [Flammeovirgaceae bacterium SG7u.132]WPO36065.1 amino acid permease [Flammeovirgaceae bacterium SG7u.111]
MAKARKFGTFGGVFTPSILTILGVIMYLRLPWIIGQAGLYATLGIVFIAHLISATTGLSVASIATDKKVKTGGTYYMISRSLGLPIGGTLGLALFVGLAFSVSLYLIGFSESFLGYWDFEVTKNNIRIAGTIVLVIVTTVTFISTSLAIRSQYIIMTTIILSLISVLLGSHDLHPVVPTLEPIADAAPFIVLFGIFFPAVTGFEAGVSMSGDLENPKKSIPMGTIAAIVVGLLVYVGLSFYFSYTVAPEALFGNKQVLSEIALIPELVVAGIWGATLSSALGSILGAPRILQATAMDKITPKVFAKGVGASNEPRNAVILTFIIAEAGILIGELDIIARVVSMFFITTYGFLNLSATIESWASSDFRPEFRIPRFVSIIGALACFIVMIQLDIVALIGATILLGLVYLYLKRKELTLSTGDTWSSFWASLVRVGLGRLSLQKSQVRNWRPNIILFSGAGQQDRRHLLDFGTAAIGKLGLLSNFELIEDKKTTAVISRNLHQESKDSNSEDGVFTRTHTCQNVYDGIDTITSTFGFSGVDPNTILMGWAPHTKEPVRFTQLLGKFQQQGMSILLLNYHKEQQFKDRKEVDIWWDGKGNFITFALTSYKFLLSNIDWKRADARLIIYTNEPIIDTTTVYKYLGNLLEEMRLNLEIKIVTLPFGEDQLYKLIQEESKDAGLVITSLPKIENGNEAEVYAKTNALTQIDASVMFGWASESFSDVEIKTAPLEVVRPKKISEDKKLLPLLERPNLPQKVKARTELEQLFDATQGQIVAASDRGIDPMLQLNASLVDEVVKILRKGKNQLSRLVKNESPTLVSDALNAREEALQSLIEVFESRRDEDIERQNDFFENVITLVGGIATPVQNLPYTLEVHYSKEELDANKELLGKFGLGQRLNYRLFKKDATYRMRFRKLVAGFYLSRGLRSVRRMSEQMMAESNGFYHQIQVALFDYNKKLNPEEFSPDDTSLEFLNQSIGKLTTIKKADGERFISYRNTLLLNNLKYFEQISEHIDDLTANQRTKKGLKPSKKDKAFLDVFDGLAGTWKANEIASINFLILELHLLRFSNLVGREIGKLKDSLKYNLQETIKSYDPYIKAFQKLERQISTAKQPTADFPSESMPLALQERSAIQQCVEQILKGIEQLPNSLVVLDIEALGSSEQEWLNELESLEIFPAKTVNFLVNTEFVDELPKLPQQLGKDLVEAGQVINDAVRISTFSVENTTSQEWESEEKRKEVKSLVKEEKDRLKTMTESLETKLNERLEELDELLDDLYEKLNPYAVIKLADNLSGNLRAQTQSKVFYNVETLFRSISENIESQLINLRYRRSEGVLAARNFQKKENRDSSWMAGLIDISRKLQPKAEVLDSLPFFYKQLFLSGHASGTELWLGREKELQLAGQAIDAFRRGNSGGILVTGEPGEGKAFLSSFIAQRFFDKKHSFTVNPPEERSISLEGFTLALQLATGKGGTIDQIMTKIPENSVLVLNDLELWWERSVGGMVVIEELERLIDRYGQKCLFIGNINIYTFKLINQMRDLESSFIRIIRCRPLNAEELRNVIMLRHRSSQLRFQLDTVDERQISKWKIAGLFTKYFDFSKGNVGVALQSWIGNIYKVENGVVHIEQPTPISLAVFQKIPASWVILLVQLLLHKHLTSKDISRLLDLDELDVFRMLNAMKRSGIVAENKGYFEIERFVRPVVIEALLENEVISDKTLS